MDNAVLVGKGEAQAWLLAQYANRHGLVAGATGTGKTVSLQALAEGFSDLGISVFAADVKGDLSGVSQTGSGDAKLAARAQTVGLANYSAQAYPVVFWDVFGKSGHPVRATISEMGPLLLARLMDVSDVQEAVLQLVFKYCDDNGLLLLDLKDLKTALSYVAQNAKSLGADYGLVTPSSVGAIQRSLITLEAEGAESFFGEPALELTDLMRGDMTGKGIINVLAADVLYQRPQLYATFLLWMLAELFEKLPEAGDLPKPKLVFFFDEAHLLFNDAPKALIQKVEQVVRLIRSKGVGIYFVTQNPLDVPDTVLGQLGNRVQHALRAFTPRDQKAVAAAAETFRPNPKLDVAQTLQQLGVGEALVSTLGDGGVPNMVDKVQVRPPRSRIGAITVEERKSVMSRSPIGTKYDTVVDRESAYEKLTGRAQAATVTTTVPGPAPAAPAPSSSGDTGWWNRETHEAPSPEQPAPVARNAPRAPAPSNRQSIWEAAAKSVVRAAGSQVGRQITQQLLRGVLGSLKR